MSSAPYMPLLASQELAAASALTAEEYGAYILLRIHQWEYGALPADEADRLARIAHVAVERWAAVSAVIRPRFGSHWHHEATQQAREKASATRALLSKAGRKGGLTKARAKRSASLTIGQAASQPISQAASLDTSQSKSLALARLKPDALPRDDEASLSTQAGDQVTYPAIPDLEEARTWLKEQNVFPGDFDELERLLMAGKLTPAILEPLLR